MLVSGISDSNNFLYADSYSKQIIELLVIINSVLFALYLKETVVQMAKANGVRWYMHVLRRDDGYVL